MQAEAETIFKMSETLEGAHFTSGQSKAFIESMALAMKTFAVTPEKFDEHKNHMVGLLNDHKNHMDGRLDDHKNHMDGRLDDIQELQRTMLRYMLGLTLVMLAGLMGALVAFLTS